MDLEKRLAIAALNDSARQTFEDCRVSISPGILELGSDTAREIVTAVQHFTDFVSPNDPYDQHDFGRFDFRGRVVLWIFDYYDADMCTVSPDPSDPSVTTRLLTIIFADECERIFGSM